MDSYTYRLYKRKFISFLKHPLTLIFAILVVYAILEFTYQQVKPNWKYGLVNIQYFNSLEIIGHEVRDENIDWWYNFVLETSYQNPYSSLIDIVFIFFPEKDLDIFNKRRRPHGRLYFNFDKFYTKEIRFRFRMHDDYDDRRNYKKLVSRCRIARLNPQTRSYANKRRSWWPEALHQPSLDEKKKKKEELISLIGKENTKNNTIWSESQPQYTLKKTKYYSTYWCEDISSYMSIDEDSWPRFIYLWSKTQ